MLQDLLHLAPPAKTIAAVALAVAAGLAIGAVRLKGVGIGVAGALFAGLALGALGMSPDESHLRVLRELGLVLFVYMVGLQVGPAFLAVLRREGLRFNALAVLHVAASAALTLIIARLGAADPAHAAGLFTGSNTNTPALAAAQDALDAAARAGSIAPDASRSASLAYAVAYPMGVLGPILVLLALRLVLRIDVDRERHALAESGADHSVEAFTLRVDAGAGRTVGELVRLVEKGVVVSRLMRAGIVSVPTQETRLEPGDIILVVGSHPRFRQLQMLTGPEVDIDLRHAPGEVHTERIVVTRAAVVHRTLAELQLTEHLGVTLTRLARAGVELTPSAHLRLNFGDAVLAVGPRRGVERAAALLGNSTRSLDHPRIAPIALGLLAAILLGAAPLAPGGAHVGPAAAALVVAILVSNLGRVGPLTFFVPPAANFTIREGGLAIFLACVGLHAGPAFISTVNSPAGPALLVLGAALTLVPAILLVLVARLAMRMNYLQLTGLLAGCVTQPAVLGFATSTTRSDSPAMVYVAVYPLTLLLRVLAAQLLVAMLL